MIVAIAVTVLSLAGCGGNSDMLKGADTGTSVTASTTPTASSDSIFTTEIINKDDFSQAVIASVEEIKTYHMEVSMGVAISGEKHTVKLASGYDNRAAPKAHVVVRTPRKNADLVVLGKEVYRKNGSAWVKSTENNAGLGQATLADIVRKFTKAVEYAIYMGQDSRGHRFDVVLDPDTMGAGEASAVVGQSAEMTLWLDDAKRVVDMKLAMGGKDPRVTMDVKLSKFGEPVSIPEVS
ncbi:hypothetical protein [Cutibacterium sp.]|uniref:hypothetical protein n=1 Tax=Cutibacterium sp. TaxID=1912221 RepID=UPI0026DCD47F|nr:hypothetical protein [Cutibacterium sp.]MDO4412501.1 hypothetical protein [Cutibacterium sp.]